MSSRMEISNEQEQPLQDQIIHQMRQMQNRIDQQEKHMAEQALIIKNLQSQTQKVSKNLKEKLLPKIGEDESEVVNSVREKIPPLGKFNGNRNLWDEWYLGASHKLRADGKAIGDDFHQFMYIYSRLEGDAAKMVSTTVKRLSDDESGKGLDFLIYLNTIFGDANKRAKAQMQLYNLKQKENESFPFFLTKFETVLADAGWTAYEDDQKISLLKNALSKEMQKALVGRKLGPTWKEAIEKLQVISSDITSIYQQHHSPPSFQPSKSSKQSHNMPHLSTDMDWEPTRSASVKIQEKRATWVSKDTLAYRKKKGLCMRCGHKGHISPQCNYLPPEKPTMVQKMSVEIEDEEEEFDVLAMPEGIKVQQGKE